MKLSPIFQIFNSFVSLHPLNDQDRSHLDQLVVEVEKKTGAQLVLSVIERCDDYPELPWKAFALGVAIVSLIMLAMDMINPVWISNTAVLLAVVTILATGAVCALLSILIPGFARFFLDKDRSEMEVRQYAESLFLSRELFATRNRCGILLLIGLFERHIVILPDTGLENRLSQADCFEIIAAMTESLSSGSMVNAFEQGLKDLEQVLSGTKPAKPIKNELPNEMIEEEGS